MYSHPLAPIVQAKLGLFPLEKPGILPGDPIGSWLGAGAVAGWFHCSTVLGPRSLRYGGERDRYRWVGRRRIDVLSMSNPRLSRGQSLYLYEAAEGPLSGPTVAGTGSGAASSAITLRSAGLREVGRTDLSFCCCAVGAARGAWLVSCLFIGQLRFRNKSLALCRSRTVRLTSLWSSLM